MKRLFPIVAAALLLTACGAPDSEPAPETTSSTAVSATSSSSATSTESTTSASPTSTVEEVSTQEPAPEEQDLPVEQPAPVEVAEPYIVECFGVAPGIQSRMSDGSVIYTDYCFNQLGGPQYLEQESWANSPENPALAEFYQQLEQEQQAPSPWVQGQIDWVDCLEAGNTDEYCRETLN